MKHNTSRAPARPAVPVDLPSQVLHAARLICADLEDKPEAREQMRQEVLATPPELMADLLQALSRERLTRAKCLSNVPPKECNP